MDAVLERLLEKVSDGERLTDGELDELSRWARQDGGRLARTTLAQALLNQDAVAEANAVLEALERDYPHDVQVMLARARALVAQERYSEAEQPIARALQANPNDLEARKALAALAMRRGEIERARALVDAVLKEDPFDGEAQQLSAELEAGAEVEGASVPLLADFTARLVRQLKAQSTPHLLQKDQLLVRLGKGGVARLDLKSLYRGFLEGSRPLEESVEAISKELAERALGVPSRGPLLERVLPVLRDSSFLDRAVGAAHREGPGGLLVFYALEDPELVRYVPDGALRSLKLTLEELDEAAWKNLDARPAEPRPLELESGSLRLSPTPTGLWTVAQGDGHDGARLVSPSQQVLLWHRVGPGPLRVYLGLRELVMLCRVDDETNVARLEGLEASPDGIAGAWVLDARGLKQLDEWAGLAPGKK